MTTVDLYTSDLDGTEIIVDVANHEEDSLLAWLQDKFDYINQWHTPAFLDMDIIQVVGCAHEYNVMKYDIDEETNIIFSDDYIGDYGSGYVNCNGTLTSDRPPVGWVVSNISGSPYGITMLIIALFSGFKPFDIEVP